MNRSTTRIVAVVITVMVAGGGVWAAVARAPTTPAERVYTVLGSARPFAASGDAFRQTPTGWEKYDRMSLQKKGNDISLTLHARGERFTASREGGVFVANTVSTRGPTVMPVGWQSLVYRSRHSPVESAELPVARHPGSPWDFDYYSWYSVELPELTDTGYATWLATTPRGGDLSLVLLQLTDSVLVIELKNLDFEPRPESLSVDPDWNGRVFVPRREREVHDMDPRGSARTWD